MNVLTTVKTDIICFDALKRQVPCHAPGTSVEARAIRENKI